MPESGTGTFIDSDDYQASLRQGRIDLLATSRGAFNARLTWATLHHLQLLHSEEDLPRIAYVSLAPALVFVAFATRPDPPMLWGGVELQTGDLIFHSRGERFHQRTTGPCSWSLVGFAPEHLERYGGALTGKPLPAPAARAYPAPRRARRSTAAATACAGLPPRRDSAQSFSPPRGRASHRTGLHSRAGHLSPVPRPYRPVSRFPIIQFRRRLPTMR
jgi:hypothetical protein